MGRTIAVSAPFSNKLQAAAEVLGFFSAMGVDKVPLSVPRAGSGGKALEDIKKRIGPCARCALAGDRRNLVFGEGDPHARLMFIGEGPGREEDIQGRPFVGDAGKLLTRLIERMGFKREEVYITNIVKCRPPGNRDPKEEEIEACLPFLKEQIRAISPEVIMTLGRIAAQALLGVKTPISRLRGSFHEFEGVPLMPTYHPAYLLRNPKDKILVWADAKKVLEKLGMEAE